MEQNVIDFMEDLAELMEKHGIEHLRSADHGYGCAIYIHGGWKNGIWFGGGKDITPKYLKREKAGEV